MNKLVTILASVFLASAIVGCAAINPTVGGREDPNASYAEYGNKDGSCSGNCGDPDN